jgi:hypothetical protein
MYDDELFELAADSADLTEQVRQVLGDEIRKRGLEDPRTVSQARKEANLPAAPQRDSDVNTSDVDLLGSGAAVQDGDVPREYTWKTVLCECEDREEAWQICEVLRQAGIESWIEGPGGSYSPYSQLDQRSPRILVAADRFDEAREIAAWPIPKEIVEQSKMQSPEFETPVCPNCGAGDPVLEGVDPFNTWKCEACGNEWTESAADLRENPERPER